MAEEDTRMIDVEPNGTNNEIDEGLYSRQLYVLDHATMQRVMTSKILLIGLNGLGVEIAKNVILTGVKSNMGQNRAEACLPKLRDLNQYVDVGLHNGESPFSSVQACSMYRAVVVTGASHKELLSLSQNCRRAGTSLILADTAGLIGRIFVDCGEKFEVHDTTGEPMASNMISSIAPYVAKEGDEMEDDEMLVTVLDEARIEFQDGDLVTFSEIRGIEGINEAEPRKVKVLSPYTFIISASGLSGTYENGGYVHQVRVPKTLEFKPFAEALRNPGEFEMTDFGKFDRPPLWHLAYLAVAKFEENRNATPRTRCEEDAQEVVALAKSLNEEHKFLEELTQGHLDLIRMRALLSGVELNPMAAFLGGIVGQEAIKACTGKFTPLKQFLYFDALECMPKNLPDEEFEGEGSRYDQLIATVGKSLTERLKNINIFLVGSGAIGCEMMKNFAMLGVGCGETGKVIVTDMDTIEKSNLNRQFLFRPQHVEQLKSMVAAQSAKQMNPEFKVEAHSMRVGGETENFFNSKFYESLDGVCNALDNVEARMYMDSQCITYGKWLLESGTLGTKGNSQVIVPRLTESYSSSRDPPEKTIPVCTLHHFPNKIEHTIQWARDSFEGLFKNSAEDVNAYLSQPEFIEGLKKQNASVRLETIRTLNSCLVKDKPVKFEQCIIWARLKLEELFNHNIQQLLFNFPRDLKTTSGAPFWSGPKRAPSPVEFDQNNEEHLSFIVAAANLRAQNYGLNGCNDKDRFMKVLATIELPSFTPKKGIKIPENEKQDELPANDGDADESEIAEILKGLPSPKELAGYRMSPIEFEKDDDTNFHIDFITAASNLRASNYSIQPADRHKTKGIAGKIMPALVTTTSVVSGLVSLELLKIIQKDKPIEDFKNGFINLALPLFAFSEPVKPVSAKVRDGWEWNLWDRFEINGPMTLAQFLEHMKEKYNLEVTMLSCNMAWLYAPFMPPAKLKDRMDKELSELFQDVAKKPLPENKTFLSLDICVDDLETGDEVEVPWVKYNFA